MGMVVQHNISAMNANNAMTRNVSGLSKSTEKLSTGYSINRAADNAAGLAISEKMRSQIRGLSQATSNANDAISLIQTAEGGLQETEDILQRMRELSVQSANGTYTDEDRDQIQLEVDALKEEIDRIAESTEFNEMKLLDGSLDGGVGNTGEYGARYGVYLSANDDAGGLLADGNLSLEGSTITSSVDGVSVALKDTASGIGGENAEWDAEGKVLTLNLKQGQTYTQSQIDDLIKNATQTKTENGQAPLAEVNFQLKNGSFTFDTEVDGFTTVTGVRASSDPDAEKNLAPLLMTEGSVSNDTYADTIQFTANNYGDDARTIELVTDVAKGKEWVEMDSEVENDEGTGIKNGAYIMHLSTGVEYSEEDLEKLLAKNGLDYDVTLSDADTPDGDVKLYAQTKTAKGEGVTLDMSSVAGQGVGADKNLGAGEGLTFQIGANGVEDQRLTVNVSDMSSTALGVGGLDISTQDGANDAINKIDDAIKTVSSQRAALGAVQNRLEHTVNSLSTAEENLQSAESQIRDTDMASEMIKYTKSNILQQASQSMLAQANQQPQGVLQLLG